MDYLISGGLGFIGKNLAIKLSKGLEKFEVLDKLTDCDLCKVYIKTLPCKTFVHLASLTNVRESLANPEEVILQNCQTTLKCLDCAKRCKSHFIFTSSMGAPQALSPYSASKLACEAFCTAYRESYGLNITILRLSNVYGPHSIHKNSVIPKFIKNCLDKRDLKIYGDGSQTRDFIYIDDVVDAIINCNNSKLLNISSGIPVSILYLSKLIKDLSTELTSFTPKIRHVLPIKGEIDKVEINTNIKPKVPLKTGLRETFKWFMEYYNYAK